MILHIPKHAYNLNVDDVDVYELFSSSRTTIQLRKTLHHTTHPHPKQWNLFL